MTAKVSLSINGTRYYDWHEMTVLRSLERTPWEFEFSVKNPWKDDEKRQIQRGDSVEVKHDNELMLTGYVDDIEPEYDASSHRLVIKGRSKLADLVDCSGFDRSYPNQSLAAIAAQICKPFGIAVHDVAKQVKPFANKSISKGDSFWNFLEELSRMRAVRLTDSPDGNLMLVTKITALSDTPLVLGGNIVSARARKSARDLFSEYHVDATDDMWGGQSTDNTTAPTGTAGDVIKRFRPLVIVPSYSASADDCAARADLQKRVHRGRAESITYTVNGWTQDNGQTWQPGVKVPIQDAYSGINEQQTIMETRCVVSPDEGAKTQITVMPNYVLDLLPVPEKDDVGGF